jgi:hypothetical protein
VVEQNNDDENASRDEINAQAAERPIFSGQLAIRVLHQREGGANQDDQQ